MPEDLLCDSKFEVGDTEKHRVKFHRDPWFCGMAVTINGEELSLVSPWSPAAHFTFRKSVKRHEFTVGKEEKHQIMIEHRRSLFVAGFRRQKYTVYVDGELLEEHYGF